MRGQAAADDPLGVIGRPLQLAVQLGHRAAVPNEQGGLLVLLMLALAVGPVPVREARHEREQCAEGQGDDEESLCHPQLEGPSRAA